MIIVIKTFCYSWKFFSNTTVDVIIEKAEQKKQFLMEIFKDVTIQKM